MSLRDIGQRLLRLTWHNTDTDTEVTQTAVIPGEKTPAPPEMGPVHLTIEPEPEVADSTTVEDAEPEATAETETT